ncbi:MAG TPA: hypothetical protein VJM75_12050 [Acidimicrobiales bacterium]|nr:hypothetical protein [Acidimicrobiales bacterium]
MTAMNPHQAHTAAPHGIPFNDPRPEADARGAHGGSGTRLVALPGAWTRDTDTRLDPATIARLQEEARESRERIDRRLATAGLFGGTAPVPELDARRLLDDAIDGDIETLERIDELHDRRRSASPRERQQATTVLAEALHRIVDGYKVGQPPASRLVRAMRSLEDGTGRLYSRLTVFREWSPRADWWEERGRWVLLGLATSAAVLVGLGHVTAGAAVVVTRTLAATITAAPRPPATTWRRLVGFSPDLASSLCRHTGDTLILGGIASGLYLDGRPVWAALTVGAAVLGLLGTTSRLAASCQGLRMPQMWLERAAKDVAFSGALMAAALVASARVHDPFPLLVAAPMIVAAVGITEMIRDAYYGRRRRNDLSRASTVDGLVPNAIVVNTGDAIVVNLCRSRPRPTMFTAAPTGGSRDGRLSVVEVAD